MPSSRALDIKRRLREGEIVYSAWLTIGSIEVAELIAGSGFDVLMIDTEHTAIGFETLEAILAAAAQFDIVTIVRVPSHDPMRIKTLLDIGVDGIMAPMVMDEGQAAALVAAIKYPPLGKRGFGPRRASDYFRNPNYAAGANDRTLVMLQIEHPDAALRAEAIAAVPGIDVLCLGPADMALACGHLDDPDHPAVQAALTRVFDAAKDAKLPVCMGRSEVASLQPGFVARGARFVIASDDVGVLRDGLSSHLAGVRRALGEDPTPPNVRRVY